MKAVTPPILTDVYRRFSGGIRFRGSYASWEEASRHAEGYDAGQILRKVREASLAVVHGEAACERDSVVFDKVPYPFPLIATLLRAAMEHSGGLTVLDFGGALGSSYYQCRDYLSAVNRLRWCVVEQAGYVECGRREFQNDILRFFDSVEECLARERPQVVLLSGVLQYLPRPADLLKDLVSIEAPYIVIDRTPVVVSGNQVITVQAVPDTISHSSYPAWLFDEQSLMLPLLQSYQEIATFDAMDPDLGSGKLRAHFKGFVFRKRSF